MRLLLGSFCLVLCGVLVGCAGGQSTAGSVPAAVSAGSGGYDSQRAPAQERNNENNDIDDNDSADDDSID